MQPPTSQILERFSLRTDINRLKADANQLPITPSSTINTDPVDVYTQAITKWLGTLPPTHQGRTYTLRELISLAVIGNPPGKPPADRHVSTALERCGFYRKRDWTVAGRNRRYWCYLNRS